MGWLKRRRDNKRAYKEAHERAMAFGTQQAEDNRNRAYAFGQQTSEVMCETAVAVIENKSDELSTLSDLCRWILKCRDHWEVQEDGTVEFRGKAVADWLAPEFISQGFVTELADNTTVQVLTMTIIATEFTNLFTEEELESEPMIAYALNGCNDYFQKHKSGEWGIPR